MDENEIYKKKYQILCKEVDKVIEELREAIYNGKKLPSALRFMSDLKYCRYAAEKYAELPNKNAPKQGE